MSVLSIGDPGLRAVAAPATAPTPVDPGRERPVDRPPLRLVEPPATRRRPVRVGTGALVVLVIGIFLLAAMHTLVVQAQYELDRVQQEVETRRGELDGLRSEVARLESPNAVVAAAHELGLVSPTERVYLDPVRPDPAVPPAQAATDADVAADGPSATDAAAASSGTP